MKNFLKAIAFIAVGYIVCWAYTDLSTRKLEKEKDIIFKDTCLFTNDTLSHVDSSKTAKDTLK